MIGGAARLKGLSAFGCNYVLFPMPAGLILVGPVKAVGL